MPLDLDDRSRASGSDGTDDGAAAASHSIPNESTLNESSLTYRAFASLEDADACVALQGEIWGTEFDRVPASVLRVAAKIGGAAVNTGEPSPGHMPSPRPGPSTGQLPVEPAERP